MVYTDLQLESMVEIAKRLDGEVYKWGSTDCFSVLNLVYRFAGLSCLDGSVVSSVLGESRHAGLTEINSILDALTVSAPSYPHGAILILTSNDVSYGTGLLLPGGVLLSSMPIVRFTPRHAIRKAARIVGSYIPKDH